MKIYSQWLSALAENWEESSLDQIRSISTALEGQLASCASSADVELQERAAELGGLLELVRKGLDAPRPVKRTNSGGGGFGSESLDPYDPESEEQGGFGGSQQEGQLPPASLILLDPLFSSHELNPVNPKAQSMVAVPEGLDLDALIVHKSAAARRVEAEGSEDEGDVDGFGRRIGGVLATEREAQFGEEKRKKKGKGVKKSGGSKRRVVEEEDPETIARVSCCRLLALSM